MYEGVVYQCLSFFGIGDLLLVSLGPSRKMDEFTPEDPEFVPCTEVHHRCSDGSHAIHPHIRLLDPMLEKVNRVEQSDLSPVPYGTNSVANSVVFFWVRRFLADS
jgi:hypothetical protein